MKNIELGLPRPRFFIRADSKIAILPPAGAGLRRVNDWLSVRAAANAADPVDVLIYQDIGKNWWDDSGLGALEFATMLAEIPKGTKIRVCINSGGGNVFDGLAIYHQLQARKSDVTCRVDGIAASIASVIAMAGTSTEIPGNALLMIHDPWGAVQGTADEMRQLADVLDTTAEVIAGVYADKCGRPIDQILADMKSELWMTGRQAKEYGLADNVLEDVELAASVSKQINLSAFRPSTDGHRKNQQTNNPAPIAGRAIPKNTMRAQILALLTRHGISAQDTATDATLIALLQTLVTNNLVTPADFTAAVGRAPITAAAPPAPAPATPAPDAALVRLTALEASLASERNGRITRELDAICAGNHTIDRAAWLPRALADETVLVALRAIPAPATGAEPLGGVGRITNSGNPMIEEYQGLNAGDQRMEFRIRNFDEVRAARRRFLPQNSNTFDANLVPDFLADAIVTTAGNRLAALAGFSRDFGVNRLAPRQTVLVRKASATSAAQTNPTNFESGDTTLDPISVTIAQINKGFTITNNELNQGFRLRDLAMKNAQTFCNAISDIWTALILDADYASPAARNIGPPAAFDSGTLADIYGDAKDFGSKNLVLDGAYIGRIAATINPAAFQGQVGVNGKFGFDSIAEQNRWTGATSTTVGVCCGPDAIAVASGLPAELPANEFQEMREVSLDNLGLTILTCSWFSRGGRQNWSSFDVMFGAAKGDTTQLVRLKPA